MNVIKMNIDDIKSPERNVRIHSKKQIEEFKRSVSMFGQIALGVYWAAQSAFSIIQEMVLGKFYTKKLQEEEDARQEMIQADRQKRQEEAKALQEKQRQQAAQKKSLKEKRQEAQAAKALKAKKAATSTTEAGRVGDRPYARGRSYKADRYDDQ